MERKGRFLSGFGCGIYSGGKKNMVYNFVLSKKYGVALESDSRLNKGEKRR